MSAFAPTSAATAEVTRTELMSTGEVVAAAVDAVVEGPVLVIGSPPPAGRDLDLLAGPEDARRIEAWLRDAGFRPWRHTWVRFEDDGGYAVELTSTEPWRTRGDDASSLFTDAGPLPGLRHLSAPDPATWLLLMARGAVSRRGRLTDKARKRVAQALERDPDAWRTAAARAEGLGMGGALRLLEQAYRAERGLPTGARAAAVAGVLTGSGPLLPRIRVFGSVRPDRVRPAIVAFAGLDGAGKSTQAELLTDRLQQVGILAHRGWAGFKTAKQIRSRLPLLDRERIEPGVEAPPYDRIMPAALRDRPVGRQAWVYVVVAVNLANLWGAVLRKKGRASVLVFDRFTPDAVVKLELHFHRTRGIDVRRQQRLFERLAPRPDVAFWVDVPAEEALRRRPEENPEKLTGMTSIYAGLAGRYGLERLDGMTAPDVLARHVLESVLRGLR